MPGCPHCHQPAMSYARKSCLGPALSVSCRHCHKRVSVSRLHAVLAFLPFAVSMWLAIALGLGMTSVFVLAAGVLAMFAIHAFFVPLVPRGD